MAEQVKIRGLKEFEKMVKKTSPRIARSVMKSAIHGVAGEIRNEMRQQIQSTAYDEGTLSKAVFTKNKRGTPTTLTSEVRIRHGKGQKRDAWYWHFIAFGTPKIKAKNFIQKTLLKIEPDIPKIMREQFAEKLRKRLEKEAKKNART